MFSFFHNKCQLLVIIIVILAILVSKIQLCLNLFRTEEVSWFVLKLQHFRKFYEESFFIKRLVFTCFFKGYIFSC